MAPGAGWNLTPEPPATIRPVVKGGDMEFIKSSYSGNGGNCVEVATTDDGIHGS